MISRFFLLSLTAFSLSACLVPTSHLPKQTLSLSWQNEAKLPYKVSHISVDYSAPSAFLFEQSATYVQDRLQQSPAAALKRWAFDKFAKEATSPISAHLQITQASIAETRHPNNTTFSDVFKQEMSYTYEGALKATLSLQDKQGKNLKQISVSSSATGAASEQSSLAEREKIWFEIMEKMVNLATDQFERDLVVTSPLPQ